MVLSLVTCLALAVTPTRAAQTLNDARALQDKRKLSQAYETAQRALKDRLLKGGG